MPQTEPTAELNEGFSEPGAVARPWLSSLVEFVLGQHALYECGLEGADHLLEVGVGRAKFAAAPAFCVCYLISRPCHHGASPA